MNTRRLKKMATEFSKELGIEAKRMDNMGGKLIWAAAGVVGFSIIRGMLKKK